jgi:hypothetical protein
LSSASKNASGILLELLLPFGLQSLSQKRSKLQRHGNCDQSTCVHSKFLHRDFFRAEKKSGFFPKKFLTLKCFLNFF